MNIILSKILTLTAIQWKWLVKDMRVLKHRFKSQIHSTLFTVVTPCLIIQLCVKRKKKKINKMIILFATALSNL